MHSQSATSRCGALCIESAITTAYANPSLRALGFFVLRVTDREYGIRAPDATLLACSFDEVERRVRARGKHRAPFDVRAPAADLAEGYLAAIYADDEPESVLGLPKGGFSSAIWTNHLVWAPDGEEGFDDGSHVLQLDLDERVRLVAFRTAREGYRAEPTTLRELELDAEDFYATLSTWRDRFHAAWLAAPKAESD